MNKKGKCFSAVNRGQRKKSDFYETPYSMTQQLYDSGIFILINNYNILEPACGNGAILKVLKKNGVKCKGYDINHKDKNKRYDFLKQRNDVDYIITNPPFSLAKEFILKAAEVCKFYFWFLLPLSYLHGKERFDLFYNKGLLDTVHVFTRYPMLGEPLREDGKYNTGMIAYAWYQFCGYKRKSYPDRTCVYWLDNQKYILRKGEK